MSIYDLIKRILSFINRLLKREVKPVMIKIFNVIIHFTEGGWGDEQTIDEWHKERGWTGDGYNIVILNGYRTYSDYKDRKFDPGIEGKVELGRRLDTPGAHCKGLNHNSVGVVFVGKSSPSPVIRRTIFNVALYYVVEHNVPVKDVIGHREAQARQGIPEDKRKLCPGYDVGETRKELEAYLEMNKLLSTLEV